MFWDTSAIIPVLLPERLGGPHRSAGGGPRSHPVVGHAGTVPVGHLPPPPRAPVPAALLTEALNRLRALVEDADTVSPTDEVRRRAGRVVAAHPLRAADALQLGAALVWCEEQSPRRSVRVPRPAAGRSRAPRGVFAGAAIDEARTPRRSSHPGRAAVVPYFGSRSLTHDTTCDAPEPVFASAATT